MSKAIADDGVELFVHSIGEGDDVVIIPGAIWLERAFDPMVQPGRQLVFYDPQGTGRSGFGATTRLTFDNEVLDLEAVRRHVGAPSVSLVGWSYLGAVAALYASRFPTRVRRLVLLCPMPARSGPFDGADSFRDRQKLRALAVQDELAELRRRAEELPTAATWRAYGLVQYGLGMADSASMANLAGDPFECEQEWAPRVEQRQQALFGTLGTFDWRPSMSSVSAPTLVVHCDLDAPRQVREEWVEAFGRAQLLELSDCGHFPFFEKPKELFDAVGRFFNQT